MKHHSPISMFSEFNITPNHRTSNCKLRVLPNRKLKTSRDNFIYKSTILWNSIITRVLLSSTPMDDGMIVPGSCINTNLSAPISFAKNRVKALLIAIQSSGCSTTWENDNFDPEHNKVKLLTDIKQ